MKKNIGKYIISIMAVIIFIALKIYNQEIFPDLLNLSSVNSSNFFALLIFATSTIFGIVVAVILLSFEFLKPASFRHKGENLFEKPLVTNVISTPVTIIVLSLISYSSVKDLQQSNNLSIAYFLGFLFVTFIILILPAIRKILESSNTLKRTKEKIHSLSLKEFKEVITLRESKFISEKSSLKLVGIRHELISFVRSCDYEAYSSILEELNRKSIELIGSGRDRKITGIVFRGLSFIWNACNSEALRVGNLQFFDTIWECIENLYEFAAKEKVFLLHFEFVDFFVDDYIKFLSRNNVGDSLTSGVKTLSKVFKQNLKFNCPLQEEINDLYYIFDKKKEMPHFINSSIQWDKINHFLFHIQMIQASAIENVDKELYGTCRFELDYIIQNIGYGRFPDLKIYQEAYIVINIISSLAYNGYTALEKDLYNDSMWSFSIDTDFISDIIKQEKFYVGRILEEISDFLIKCQRAEKLDESISLNYWGALGRHISKEYLTNQTVQKSFAYIIQTFEVLKNEIEKSQLPGQVKNYNEIKKQLESLEKWLVKDNVGKKITILTRIEELVNDFKKVSIIQEMKIVKWKD